MIRTHLPLRLDGLLDHQHNLVTRFQVLGGGMTDMTIYRRIRSGTWQRVLPGVYLVVPSSLTTEQRRIAAALFVGVEGQLTGLNALHWYGFDHAPSTDKVHVNVPHGLRRLSNGFVVVHRTLEMDERERDGGLYRVTSIPRAVVDAGRFTTNLRDVRAIVAEAVQRGRTSPDAIDEEIRRAARSRTGLVRRALTEVCHGAQSAPEAELRELVGTSKILPDVLWNVRLVNEYGKALPTPDGWMAEGAIALEVDSSRYHAEGEGWAQTLRRHNRYGEHGILPLHYTPTQLRTESRQVLRSIERAYQARATLRANVIVVDPTALLGRDPA